MIGIEVNAKQLKELREACGRAKKDFSKQIARAINDTAKQTKTNMSTEIRSVVNLKKPAVDKVISTYLKATADNLRAVVLLRHQERGGFGLQHFGAKQNGRGVSYKIGKGKGKGFVAGAFIGAESGPLHGGVFKRMGEKRKMTKGRYQGRMRQPIVKLYGVSAFGAYAKNQFENIEPVFIKDKLHAQMERRIRENVLRANGLIPK